MSVRVKDPVGLSRVGLSRVGLSRRGPTRRIVMLLLCCAQLCGCQAPIVPARLMTYKADAVIDGKTVHLQKDYACHYEDISYFSEKGSSWHVRTGWQDIRVEGVLADGTPFELVPDKITGRNRLFFCDAEDTQRPSRLFLHTGPAQALGFDALHTASPAHTIALGAAHTDSRLSFADVFRARQGGLDVPGAQYYHSVWAAVIPASVWRSNQELAALVDGEHVMWLEPGHAPTRELAPEAREKRYRFVKLAMADKTIAAYRERAAELSFERRDGVWRPAGRQDEAVTWFADASDAGSGRGTVAVEYAGVRLDALLWLSVVFYVPGEDSIVFFHGRETSLMR